MRNRLSVCCLACSDRAVPMLELVRPVADELVVAVDADARVAKSPALGALADRLFRVPLEPPLERYLPWLHNVCGGDWILRLEEDERPSSELLESLPSLIQARDVLQYRVQCRRPNNQARGDYEVRLVRNDPATLRFTGALGSWPDAVLPARYLEAPIERVAPAGARARVQGGTVDVALAEVLRFAPGRALREDAYNAEIECLEERPGFRAGLPRELLVRVRNRGAERFPWGAASPAVRLSYHWRTVAGEDLVLDGQRTMFTHDLAPGGETVVPLLVAPPLELGEYVLVVDLVHEGVRWFGCEAQVPVLVESAAGPATAVEPGPRIVFITGMHRAGTSLVTHLAGLLGAYLGEPEDLLAPAADNPSGFWEHRELIALNDTVLASMGGSAVVPPSLPFGWQRDPRLDLARASASQLVERLARGRELVVFKDPRTSLTLPFWRTVVPAAASVLVLRHPLEVARSLRARDGMGEAEAARLYVRYVVEAFRNDPSCGLITYAEFFADFDRAAAKLAGEIGLEPSPERLRGAVEAALRHSWLDQLPGAADSAVAVALYRLLAAGQREVVLGLSDALLVWAAVDLSAAVLADLPAVARLAAQPRSD